MGIPRNVTGTLSAVATTLLLAISPKAFADDPIYLDELLSNEARAIIQRVYQPPRPPLPLHGNTITIAGNTYVLIAPPLGETPTPEHEKIVHDRVQMAEAGSPPDMDAIVEEIRAEQQAAEQAMDDPKGDGNKKDPFQGAVVHAYPVDNTRTTDKKYGMITFVDTVPLHEVLVAMHREYEQGPRALSLSWDRAPPIHGPRLLDLSLEEPPILTYDIMNATPPYCINQQAGVVFTVPFLPDIAAGPLHTGGLARPIDMDSLGKTKPEPFAQQRTMTLPGGPATHSSGSPVEVIFGEVDAYSTITGETPPTIEMNDVFNMRPQ